MEFVTTKQHRYGGKMRKIGDTYEIAGKTVARLMQALGLSIPAPVIVTPVVAVKVQAPARMAPVVAPAPVVIESPVEQAAEAPTEPAGEIEPAPVAEPDTDKPKRAYKRRDLSAE